MTAVFTAYEVLSFVSLALLLFAAPAIVLPSKVTKVPSGIYSSTTVSLVLVAIAKSSLAIIETFINTRHGAQGTLCDVDAALMVFCTTAVVAHIPLVALNIYRQTTLAIKPWSFLVSVVLLIVVYALGVAPLIAVLAAWNSANVSYLGVWWGTFCQPTMKWWTPLRLSTLFVPLGISWMLCVPAIINVTCHAHRLSAKQVSLSLHHLRRKVFTMAISTLLVAVFLIIEAVSGGSSGYWAGHAVEGATGIFVFLYTLDWAMLRMWARWLGIRTRPDESFTMINSRDHLPLDPEPPASIMHYTAPATPSIQNAESDAGTIHIMSREEHRAYVLKIRPRDAESTIGRSVYAPSMAPTGPAPPSPRDDEVEEAVKTRLRDFRFARPAVTVLPDAGVVPVSTRGPAPGVRFPGSDDDAEDVLDSIRPCATSIYPTITRHAQSATSSSAPSSPAPSALSLDSESDESDLDGGSVTSVSTTHTFEAKVDAHVMPTAITNIGNTEDGIETLDSSDDEDDLDDHDVVEIQTPVAARLTSPEDQEAACAATFATTTISDGEHPFLNPITIPLSPEAIEQMAAKLRPEVRQKWQDNGHCFFVVPTLTQIADAERILYSQRDAKVPYLYASSRERRSAVDAMNSTHAFTERYEPEYTVLFSADWLKYPRDQPMGLPLQDYETELNPVRQEEWEGETAVFPC